MEKHVQAALFILKIYWIEYFKSVYLNINNCAYKIPFRKCTIVHFSATVHQMIIEKWKIMKIYVANKLTNNQQ